MYDNAADAINRLEGTFIRFKGKVVMVVGGAQETLHLLDVVDDKVHRVKYTDDRLGLSSPPLGYLRVKGEYYYISRRPARQWKQGVRRNSLGLVADIDDLQLSRALQECVDNTYPTIKKCLVNKTVAFSRKFALNVNNNLCYRGKVVGEGMILSPEYEFLQEELDYACQGKI